MCIRDRHSTLRFHEIVIPTTDTLKFTSLLNFSAVNQLPALVIGPIGTGKTLYTHSFIKSLDPSCFAALLLVFSANLTLSLIHICRCRRIERCRSRWSPYH
eukprot:TRINITY_DN27516_c0_g1_i1.p1 TRINITY_DN27516_c0_g1~~TRINITY_DN27516_c0_g1_i1.p1  ORF type:complete len:101 (+),score=11.44 TRINITY_DN27516_c0_g1_i1:63-365(+)